MTVTSMVPNDAPYLPNKVTTVARETLRSFPHSKKVGNYLLGHTLGEGSFAKVKEALHIPTGELVAVKIIDKKKSREDSYVRKNLRREGKILQLIRHRHIVQLLEIMETQNSYYLVTELCRGGDLMDYISARRKLPEAEVKKYIRQIVSAIDYLHRLGILHRDLKIENLLLDEFQDMKIIDFGLSNCIKMAQTKEGPRCQEYCVTQCGSPAYAAPELLGRRKYGPQVDVWSIGVNMYAMLTGSLPYTVEPFNIKTLHTKMLNGQMNPMPDGVSKDCRDIMKKFLTADPDRRISLDEAMKHPWIADGPGNPMPSAPCPNKLKTETLDNSILKHMSEKQGFRIGEIVKFVTGNIPSSSNATYHLTLRKLNKHYGNLRASGRIAADPRLLRKSQNPTLPQMKTRVTSHPHQGKTLASRPGAPHIATMPRGNAGGQQKVGDIDNECDTNDTDNDIGEGTVGNGKPFMDLLTVKGKTDALRIPRAKSPVKAKTDVTETTYTVPIHVNMVAKKYIINTARRTPIGHPVKANEIPRATANDTDNVVNRSAANISGIGEGHFRKRANSVPGIIERPQIAINKPLFADEDRTKDKVNITNNNTQVHKQILYVHPDLNSPRTPNHVHQAYNINAYTYGSDSRQTQLTGMHVQHIKQTPIQTVKCCDHVKRNNILQNDDTTTTEKHLLSRPTTRTNKVQQGKPDHNTEVVVDEHISEISGSLPRTATSLSTSSNQQPPSPVGLLPSLSPPGTAALKRSS